MNALHEFQRSARTATALAFCALARNAEPRVGAKAITQALGGRWTAAMSGRASAANLLHWLIGRIEKTGVHYDDVLEIVRAELMDETERQAFAQLPHNGNLTLFRFTEGSGRTGWYGTQADARWVRPKPPLIRESLDVNPREILAVKILRQFTEIVLVPGHRFPRREVLA